MHRGVLKVVACVGGRDDRADARFVTRNGRKPDGLGKDTRLEQPIRQQIGLRAIACNHRRNRALADARVESKPCEPLFEETCVVPQPFHDLRLFQEDVQRSNARGRHGGRMGGGEQERPCALMQEIDQVAIPGHVTAEHADRL
jgi:hypothetical protein